jgi:hypothetical protein
VVPSSAFSYTMKMEAVCSSETSVDFHWDTLCYIPGSNSLDAKSMVKCAVIMLGRDEWKEAIVDSCQFIIPVTGNRD